MLRKSEFAIAGAITFVQALLLITPNLSAFAETVTTSSSRGDEIADDRLPGGAAVGRLLQRVQDELDNRKLTQASQQQLEEMLEKYPTNYKLHLYYGLVLDEVGLPEEALAQYQEADRLGPTDPRATAGIMNHVLAGRDKTGSQELLNKALKRFPNSPDILFYMGKNFKEHGHYAEAENVLRKAYDSGYKIKHLPAELAELYLKDEPLRALKLANEELAVEPDNILALEVKGGCLMRLGLLTSAIVPYSRLYKLAPTYNRAAENYLRCLYWSGDYKTALMPGFYFTGKEAQYVPSEHVSIAVLTKIIKSLPFSFVEQQLAQFYHDLAANKNTVQPAFHYEMAKIFYQLGHGQQAKAELDQYLAAEPRSVDGLMLAGKLQENFAHNYPAALRIYETAHALSPYNEEVEFAYNRMEEVNARRSSDWARSLRDWLSGLFGQKILQ